MPNPVINRRLVNPSALQPAYDPFQEYSVGSSVGGLNGSGTGLLSPLPTFFRGSFVSKGTFARVYSTEDNASYTNGTAVSGLNGGIDFSGAYATMDTTIGFQWALQVIANGGAQPSATSINAITAFYAGLVSDGLDSLMLAVNPFAPDSLIAALTPIPMLSPKGNVLWTNNNFVGGDLTANGLTGNTTTKFLDTGFVPSTDAAGQNDVGFVVYAYNTTANGGINGCDSASDTQFYELAPKFSDNNTYERLGGLANSVIPVSPGNGYYAGFRTSSTVNKLYFANSGSAHAQLGVTDTTASGALPSVSAYIFALHQGLLNSFFSSDTISFAAATRGLTSAQSANLFSRIQTLRTSLGGGFR